MYVITQNIGHNAINKSYCKTGFSLVVWLSLFWLILLILLVHACTIPQLKIIKFTNMTIKYRPDIDGLRAIAVLSVVIFHFQNTILPGGFVGVDVFFTISGYLMTGIILSSIQDNSFSIYKFYLSRAKRILPALSLLCATLMVAGWFLLPPLQYTALGKHVLSSVLFVSNFVYWQESGYFDAESHEKWLLHTWSLSTEWQFYLLFPIFILLIQRLLGNRLILPSLVVLLLVSFCYSAIYSSSYPVSSYYLLPSRAWEMIAGGLAYFYITSKYANKSVKLHYAGVGVILFSCFYISSSDIWPGYFAALPVIGSCMYLAANHQDKILNSAPFKLIGRWSYSIYLWHWPIVVYCHINNININILLGIFISIILGFISFSIIEKRRSVKLLAGTPFTAAAACFLFFNSGYAYQMPKDVYSSSMLDPKSDDYGGYTWKRIKELNTGFTSNKNNKILVIGDSQAGDFINILDESGLANGYEIRSRMISTRCSSFYLNQEQRNKLYTIMPEIQKGLITKTDCDKEIGRVFDDKIVYDADVIFIAMNWKDYAIPYNKESLINLREKTKKPIYIIGNKNYSKALPSIIYNAFVNKTDIGKSAYIASEKEIQINHKMKEMVTSSDMATYINLKGYSCNSKINECVTSYKGEPILYDAMHTTKNGAVYYSKALQGKVKL